MALKQTIQNSRAQCNLMWENNVCDWVIVKKYIVLLKQNEKRYQFVSKNVYWKYIDNHNFYSFSVSIYNNYLSVECTKTFDPDAKRQTMSKLKNMAKDEIVLHDPYSNVLCRFT